MQRIKSFENDAILYVVATPIGNLKELSLRGQEVLSSVDFVASEDTRTTASLLKQFGISKPSISCHEHNEQEASQKIISLLKEGKSIALTSDAGYPGISDPGAILIRHCIENDIPVSIINGANAFIPALVGSGLDTTHFYFHGFLNSKRSTRRRELEENKSRKETMIFYESPHRIEETLLDMYEVLGNRQASIAREITKLHEEYIRGSLEELSSIDPSSLRGEMVVVVEGNKDIKMLTEDDIKSLLEEELKQGKTLKDAIKEVSKAYSLKKNIVYDIATSLKR
ncbi:MAG: 16S rRNA (cytidine(1402)-2'-O)-methyltransferase [Erysipelotrichaceae bacterium]|nr:16S rRNA (cytidine(1402)-2'-O)-methyltransferase [Erysipelotrichaceae bacterium]